MALRRPKAQVDRPAAQIIPGRPKPDNQAGLTRAQQHAARRSAPLTRAQFKAAGELADLRVSPLRKP